jgi:hypothetical protein
MKTKQVCDIDARDEAAIERLPEGLKKLDDDTLAAVAHLAREAIVEFRFIRQILAASRVETDICILEQEALLRAHLDFPEDEIRRLERARGRLRNDRRSIRESLDRGLKLLKKAAKASSKKVEASLCRPTSSSSPAPRGRGDRVGLTRQGGASGEAARARSPARIARSPVAAPAGEAVDAGAREIAPFGPQNLRRLRKKPDDHGCRGQETRGFRRTVG